MPLEVDYDECGIEIYKVYNDYGDLIMVTGDGFTASFIAQHIKNVPRYSKLVIGGDPGSKRNKKLFRSR